MIHKPKKLCPFIGMQECRGTECALYENFTEMCCLFGASEIYRLEEVTEGIDEIKELLNAIGECICKK